MKQLKRLNTIPSLVRVKGPAKFFIAIVAGPFLGNLLAMFPGLGIDLIFGHNVAGGDWRLTTPNILYSAFMGYFTGLSAGYIAGVKGRLVGATAQFFPLLAMIGISICLNRDLLGNFQVRPAVWTWIGLLPAIIGGELGEQFYKRRQSSHLRETHNNG